MRHPPFGSHHLASTISHQSEFACQIPCPCGADVMFAGAPYKWVVPKDPAASDRSVCALVVNSFFEKHVCKRVRDAGLKLHFLKLHRFLDLAATRLARDARNAQGAKGAKEAQEARDAQDAQVAQEAQDALSERRRRSQRHGAPTAAQLWERIRRAVLLAVMADYPSFAGTQGQQLIGFDCVLDSRGHVRVLEANLTPGTTEDDAGRKLKMHSAWIRMTGSFSHDFDGSWASGGASGEGSSSGKGGGLLRRCFAAGSAAGSAAGPAAGSAAGGGRRRARRRGGSFSGVRGAAAGCRIPPLSLRPGNS